MSSRRRRSMVVTALLASALASGCSHGESASGNRCGLSPKLVPSCGALWGITTETPTAKALLAAENAAGRPFDFVYRFHDVNNTVPTEEERAIVNRGGLLHLSIDARDYASPRGTVTWAAIAAGEFDDDLRAQAVGIASLHKAIFLTFEHEADQQAKQALGTGSEFVAAWRHVHELFTKAGATNAVWVWVMMGTEAALPRAAELWPGNDVVDWISWDVYNASGCRAGQVDPKKYVSFEASMRIFYDWVRDKGPSLGMDISKPMMISETGSVSYPDDPHKTAEWYAQIPSVLRAYPSIKAVGLWDHTGQNACDYRFAGKSAALQGAVREAGLQPWVNPRGSGAGDTALRLKP